MAVTVLVVDDSAFFRQQIIAVLKKDARVQVVGIASHGREAVEKAIKLKPDVITMDYEMPVMDGISAVREIMAKAPTTILMFSSLTTAGARVTLDALDAGAVDFLPKYREDMGQEGQLNRTLVEKILSVARKNRFSIPSRPQVSSPIRPSTTAPRGPKPDLVLIGTSTGGPVALQKILTQIPANFPVPILLIQHMPAAFTGPFAERLNGLCRIGIKEAADDMSFSAGHALLAPGGRQMVIANKGRIKILDGDARLNYKPSVDVTFGSAVKYYDRRVLAIVLTGMGADGREGARLLKKAGAQVWVQEGSSCVIDGMPSSVSKAGLADRVIHLDDMAKEMIKACGM